MDDPAKLLLLGKLVVVTSLLYVVAVTLPKLAILSLYLRILVLGPYRLACYIIAEVLLASAIANILTDLFECSPISYLWDKTTPGGHYIDTKEFYQWGSFPNIVTDVAMLILPLPMGWKIANFNGHECRSDSNLPNR